MSGPRVIVLSLGGTIAMTSTGGEAVQPRLSGAELVAAVPGLVDVADVHADSFRQLPGAHLGFDDIGELADRVDAELEAGAHGVVITQGTDTLEETSFMLDLLMDVDAPVVMTGAMRNATLPGADGPANLLASVQVAASPAARGLGVLVVMNDEIHAARFVRKRHSARPSAFASDPGPVGWLAEGRPRIVTSLPRWMTIGRAATTASVGLYTATFGEDGAALEAMLGAGLDGLVVEALGGGHVPATLVPALERAAATMPVVFVSRTGGGDTLRETYGFPGSETDLIARGLIPGGWLDGRKARVLLTALLRNGADVAAVRSTFESEVSV